MKERSICLRDWEVRAVLNGGKTQLRRMVKPQPDSIHDGEPYWHIGGYRAWAFRGVTDPLRMGAHNPLPCLYGQPGDRLWVKEAFGTKVKIIGGGAGEFTTYKATDPNAVYCEAADGSILPIKWKPGVQMPRWASRITLEIADVRVERLQDIGNDGREARHVKAEGLQPEQWSHLEKFFHPDDCPALAFKGLWESINGAGSWDANPWVWVIEFKRIKP